MTEAEAKEVREAILSGWCSLGMDEVRGAFSTKLSVMKDYPDKMTVEPTADVVGDRRSHV